LIIPDEMEKYFKKRGPATALLNFKRRVRGEGRKTDLLGKGKRGQCSVRGCLREPAHLTRTLWGKKGKVGRGTNTPGTWEIRRKGASGSLPLERVTAYTPELNMVFQEVVGTSWSLLLDTKGVIGIEGEKKEVAKLIFLTMERKVVGREKRRRKNKGGNSQKRDLNSSHIRRKKEVWVRVP